MKKAIILTVVLLSGLYTFGQEIQDPEAKRILDQVAKQAEAYQSMKAEFTLKYTNRREEIETENDGVIYLKDSAYVLETMGSKVIFNGQDMYTIMEDLNEVTITQPNEEDESFVSNPAKIFDWYDRDFKYRYKSSKTIDGQQYHEIELYPKSLDQPYSRINILVNNTNYHLYKIESSGKRGDDYLITITHFETDVDLPDSFFSFNQKDYPKAEIIDMRF